jgi:hypothetical protein
LRAHIRLSANGLFVSSNPPMNDSSIELLWRGLS